MARIKWPRWLRRQKAISINLIEGAMEPGATAYSFSTYASEGYEKCATVYRCVNIIADAGANIPIGIEREDGTAIDNHPLATLFARPNALMGDVFFKKFWAASMLIGGQAFIWANRLGDGNGRVAELWPLPPSEVQVVAGDRAGEVSHYVWTWRGTPHVIAPSDMLYTWFPSPEDLMTPQSPLRAAVMHVNIATKGARWNYSLLSNYAKPPFWIGVDKARDDYLSDKQVQELRQMLKARHQGAANAGNIPIMRLPGLTLNTFGWSPADMDWLEGAKHADQQIANVYGVPPEMIGGQKTYENFQVAERVLYNGPVLGLFRYLVSEFNNWPALGLRPDERLALVLKDVQALRPDQDALATRLALLIERGIITRNEARAALGYTASDDPMADVLTVGKEVATLGLSPFNAGTGAGKG